MLFRSRACSASSAALFACETCRSRLKPVKIGSGTTLIIDPCTRVVLGSDANIEVKGHLVTQGQVGKEISFEEGDLTTPELLAASEVRKRLESEEWTFGVDERVAKVAATPEENRLRVWHNQRRTEGCALDLTLVTEGGHTIRDLAITGTPLFLQEDGLTQVVNYLRGCYLNPPTVGERVMDLYEKLHLLSPGANAADFLILIGDTIDKMSPGGR